MVVFTNIKKFILNLILSKIILVKTMWALYECGHVGPYVANIPFIPNQPELQLGKEFTIRVGLKSSTFGLYRSGLNLANIRSHLPKLHHYGRGALQ